MKTTTPIEQYMAARERTDASARVIAGKLLSARGEPVELDFDLRVYEERVEEEAAARAAWTQIRARAGR